jgi:hypothetical protein
MITYSVKSRMAVGRLMRPYNDLDIYVEDSSYIGVYERMINNALNGLGSVSRVIPLGPSERVIEAAKNDISSGGRPRIYIVDGDLDLIARQRHKLYVRLHRLNVYSLENLLMETQAIESYAAYALPHLSRRGAIDALDIGHLIHNVEVIANIYTVVLAVARRLDLRDDVLKFDHTVCMARVGGKYVKPDLRRLGRKVFEIIQFIKVKCGLRRYKAAKASVYEHIKRKRLSGFIYFPGKSIVWMMNERIGAARGFQLQQKAIISFLANECCLTLDPKLATRLRGLLRSPQ